MFVSVPNRMSMNHQLKQHLALNLVETLELTEEPRLETAVQNDNLNQKHHSLQASMFYPIVAHCQLTELWWWAWWLAIQYSQFREISNF